MSQEELVDELNKKWVPEAFTKGHTWKKFLIKRIIVPNNIETNDQLKIKLYELSREYENMLETHQKRVS